MMRLLALWLAFVAATVPAEAHVTATGLARVTVTGERVFYSLALSLPELPSPAAASLTAAANGDRASAETIADEARRSVTIAMDGKLCRSGRLRIGGAGANETRASIEIDFVCATARGKLDIGEDWRAFLGEHYQTIANITTPGGERQAVFGEGTQKLALDLARPIETGWLDFIKLGVEHILTGYDHLLFLIALLATARGLWSLVQIVTAFTLAHSVTLSLAVLGLVRIPAQIIEPLIAATIIWVALENLIARDPGRQRWTRSFAFGLVHGFGFASALVELDLSGSAIVRALVGFNLGVELGQLVFVALFLAVLTWLATKVVTWPRLAALPRLASMAIALVGAYWLIERLFF